MATDCNGDEISIGDFVCHTAPNSQDGFGGRVEVEGVGSNTVTLKGFSRTRIPVFLSKRCMIVDKHN